MAGWVCGLLILMIMMIAWICGWDLWPGPVARPVSYSILDNDVDEIDAGMMHVAALVVPSCRRCNARNHTPDTTVYPRSKGMSMLISWAGIQGEKAGTTQCRLEVRTTWRTPWGRGRTRGMGQTA